MSITAEYIDRLCLRGESNILDYKEAQYPFCNANDYQKSELLKDILAFANSDRNESAYILIGVREENHLGVILGLKDSDLIDDAKLQQFINGKTNKRIVFYTYPVDCAGNLVQVIEIPECPDARPFHINKDFGGIKKDEVKIRIGSSTMNATPDMIKTMGINVFQKMVPTLDIDLISPNLQIDSKCFQAYAITSSCDVDSITEAGQNYIRLPNSLINESLFREKIEWLSSIFSTIKVDIYLKNMSPITADNLYIESAISSFSDCNAQKIEGFPQKPNDFLNIRSSQIQARNSLKNYCLRPGQEDFEAHRLYFKVEKSGTVTIEVKIMANNLPNPIQKKFEYSVNVLDGSFDKDKINKSFDSFENEDTFYTFISDFLDKNEK